MNNYTLPLESSRSAQDWYRAPQQSRIFPPRAPLNKPFRQIPGGTTARGAAAGCCRKGKHSPPAQTQRRLTLLRQFDLSVSESTFKRYKREYCYVLARESHLISDASP